MHPMYIINVHGLISSGLDLEEIVDMVICFGQFLQENLTIPGVTEGNFTLLDCDKVSPTQIPVKKLGGIISVLQDNYKSRMSWMFIVNVHWMLTGLWKVIKPILDPVVAQKIVLAGKKYEQMYKYVDKNSLEQKFGGNCPNLKEGQYFPPVMR